MSVIVSSGYRQVLDDRIEMGPGSVLGSLVRVQHSVANQINPYKFNGSLLTCLKDRLAQDVKIQLCAHESSRTRA